jgi:hypothetical protein
MKLEILECQEGVPCIKTDSPAGEGYTFVRKTHDGLYEFATGEGKRELFARRTSYAGWHLKRGAYVYEFCRSA